MMRVWFLLFLIAVSSVMLFPVRASPDAEYTAQQLIQEVNALRVSQGLPAYQTNSILMQIAQAHANYMAASGQVTHYGPNGERPYQRALAAGYPLAGDLSQGGFFSENIVGGSNLSPKAAVQSWQGDAPHLNTMLSPNLQEIGAGVAVRDGYYYYVIDCARPTTSRTPQPYTPGPGLPAPGTFSASEWMMPVFTVTPREDGRVIHVVQSGQTLWSIAIAYGIKIEDLRRLNNLYGNTIYEGQKLLITRLPTATPTSVPPTDTPTLWPTATPRPVDSPTPSPPPTPTPVTAQQVFNRGWPVALLVVTVMVIAGLAALIFSGEKEKTET
jgi:hypothetical protein